jgi:hypothetical protein
MDNINPCGRKYIRLDFKTQSVPRSKHSLGYKNGLVNALKRNNRRLFFCSEIYVEHIDALWAEHRFSDC